MDPKGKPKEEWYWAELNLFHSADVARQLLEDVESYIGQAEYLRKKEKGEVEVNKFKELWSKINGKEES